MIVSAPAKKLLCFFVDRLGPAKFAVFLQFQAILHGPFVFCRRVVSLLALCAGQRDNASHES
jgi:hypothetical protein